jgi:uncharacterized membrane protein
MLRLALTLLIVSFLSFALISNSYSSITVYYNGTVIMYLQNQTVAYLIGQNYRNLTVTGGNYSLQGSLIKALGNIKVQYFAQLQPGVIDIKQNSSFYITIILPTSSKIIYINTPPLSYITDDYQNLTFYSSYVYVIYNNAITQQAQESISLPLYLSIIGIILSSVTSSLIIYQFIRSRLERPKVENVSEYSEEVDDRDIMVLKCIDKGLSNLSKISDETGIPRTTVYRRIKKLVKQGYIEEIRERNKVQYRLTQKGKDLLSK